MTPVSADQLAADLAGLPVQIGVLRGWWSIPARAYPELVVTFAAPSDLYEPGALTVRLDCSEYPHQAPTGHPVDAVTGEFLSAHRRPTHGRCGVTFRADWEGGRALYLPVDRVALNGHPDWQTKHAHELWDPHRGIARLLHMVRRDLTEGRDASLSNAA